MAPSWHCLWLRSFKSTNILSNSTYTDKINWKTEVWSQIDSKRYIEIDIWSKCQSEFQWNISIVFEAIARHESQIEKLKGSSGRIEWIWVQKQTISSIAGCKNWWDITLSWTTAATKRPDRINDKSYWDWLCRYWSRHGKGKETSGTPQRSVDCQRGI